MAALLFKGKKGVNLSCASPASTATSTSVDRLLSVDLQRTRELDCGALRQRREQQALSWVPPSLSKNKTPLQKSRRSWGRPSDPASPTASTRFLLDDDEADAFFDVFQELDSLPAWIPIDPDRFRSATGDDSAALKPSSSSSSCSSSASSSSTAAAAKERDQVLVGVSSSSSYLPLSRLIQIEKSDGSPVLRPSAAAPPPATLQTPKGGDSAAVEQSPLARSRKQAFSEASSSSSSSLQDRFHSVQGDNSTVLKQPSSSSSSSSARTQDQVVVLRVSLHCKGCETKVRKHISRMKGVTSFNIDFTTKKVTVIGNVTPLGVLSSVSKVKSAQFWPSLSQEHSTSSP